MPYDPQQHVGRLKRLPAGFYRGRAVVHWTMAMEGRKAGWLDELHHARVREWLCHALSRHGLVCPVYCLMPDHAHFLCLGISDFVDQKRAMTLFRRSWNADLRRRGFELQRQAFDHVLREHEREHDALVATWTYVLENPVRGGLIDAWRAYPFLGALVPGYPDLDPRAPDFGEVFWRIYEKLQGPGGVRAGASGESLTASATGLL